MNGDGFRISTFLVIELRFLIPNPSQLGFDLLDAGQAGVEPGVAFGNAGASEGIRSLGVGGWVCRCRRARIRRRGDSESEKVYREGAEVAKGRRDCGEVRRLDWLTGAGV